MARHYQPRVYAVGERLLELRNRTGLTQAELARLVGVSKRSMLKWEGGEGVPNGDHLRDLIAVFVARGAFTAGQEPAEAAQLWEQVRLAGTGRQGLFDAGWFAQVLAERRGAPAPPGPSVSGEVLGLPPQPTSFLGRESELAEIVRILDQPACRLLTLLGPGGIGKTRLALAVAAQRAHTFQHGAAFVELAAVDGPDQIVSAVGDTLGLSFAGLPDPTAHLLDHLSARQMLLVLDNFEHLVADTSLVLAIGRRAPRVTLLVTSRERLHLRAEWLFDVEGLACPPPERCEPAGPQQLAEVAGYSAVQLLLQRARQVQPRFALSEATLAAVVDICGHVAGMPLAIELVAAALRSLPLAQIERHIRSDLDGLASTLRDLPARHRSMRAVFEHSWRLLSERERALFCRLAVFRGGWSLEAAERVAGADLDDLGLLVDKSLVRSAAAAPRDLGPDGPAEPRFSMLEPLREYALEQLAARGELEALRRAHAGYCLDLAQSAAAQWDTRTTDRATRLLEREHDNLRAALQWGRDGGDLTVGLRLAGALQKFWQRRGRIREGCVWLAELLARAEREPAAASLAAQLSATQAAAWLASNQHDFAQAERLFERSIVLQHRLGETDSEPQLLFNAALQARAVGQYRRGTALLEQSVALQRARGDRGSLSACGLGLAIYGLGLLLREQSRFAQAERLFEECAELHRELGDREGVAQSVLALGDSARDQGDVALMRTYVAQSLVVFRELGVQWAIGFAEHNLALGAYLEGDLAAAHTLAQESVARFRRLHADASVAEVLITQAKIARARGEHASAHAALREALLLAWAVGPRLLVAAALEGLAAGLALRPGQAGLAVRLLAGADALRAHMGTPVRPLERAELDQSLEQARARVGPQAFAELWRQGAAAPLEQLLGGIPGAETPAAA